MLRVFIFLLSLVIVTTTYSGTAATTAPTRNWYDQFIFKDPSFTFELIRTLGYTYEKGADIGESISTAKKITDEDFTSWYQEWTKTANRIESLAQKATTKGNTITARNAFLRAANYYRTAGFYMVSPTNRPQSIATYRLSHKAFLHAIESLPYINAINIPYEQTTLPGYFVRSDKTNAPLVIVNTGFDGTAEELYFEVGAALHERGYNCLLVEGPGQGGALRTQNLHFRHDWENVVGPIIDYAETLPDTDKNKIALMGISMGGYLAPRAAAFEPRIKAVIANGGVYDFGEAAYKTLPPDLIKMIDDDPAAFDKMMIEGMKKNTIVRWFYENGMWSFGVTTPAAFMKKIKLYTLKDVAQSIKMPTLVVDSESDLFMGGQARALYNHLTGSKTFLLFTKQEAAESHCQMGATAISNERILDWLDDTLDYHAS